MFGNLQLSEPVLKGLEAKGFETPTEIQLRCIPLIAEGRDVVGRSQTGSGKTLAFGLPAIDKVDVSSPGVEVLVICPTRELATQVTDEIRKISSFREGCSLVPVYGGADMTRQIKALKRCKIVVGTPGRLTDHINRRTLKLHNVKMLVLDEADEMLNMGFKEDIDNILKSLPSNRQTVMFSATFPPAIKAITRDYMNRPEYVEVGNDLGAIAGIAQSYILTERRGKKAALVKFFSEDKPERAMVFCNTKRMVDEICGSLNDNGVNALAIHGDMPQSKRRAVMNDIKNHKVSVLVATDVAARGIDINAISHVLNFDLPNDVEYYLHRIGRTARAGLNGAAVTFINTPEQLQKLKQYKNSMNSEITEHKLSDSAAFAGGNRKAPGAQTSNYPRDGEEGGRGYGKKRNDRGGNYKKFEGKGRGDSRPSKSGGFSAKEKR